MTKSPDPLEQLLEKLKAATPEPPGSVARDVWCRIADAEAVAAQPSVFERIELAFSRPAFAVAFVAACVASGLFLAEFRIARQHAAESALLEREYLRLIAPLLAKAPAADNTTTGMTP